MDNAASRTLARNAKPRLNLQPEQRRPSFETLLHILHPTQRFIKWAEYKTPFTYTGYTWIELIPWECHRVLLVLYIIGICISIYTYVDFDCLPVSCDVISSQQSLSPFFYRNSLSLYGCNGVVSLPPSDAHQLFGTSTRFHPVLLYCSPRAPRSWLIHTCASTQWVLFESNVVVICILAKSAGHLARRLADVAEC